MTPRKQNEYEEESTRQIGPIESLLIKAGIPVTRENWIWAAYLGDEPKGWSQELEDELPEHLRLDEEALQLDEDPGGIGASRERYGRTPVAAAQSEMPAGAASATMSEGVRFETGNAPQSRRCL
jgi:hypothetical protein